MVFKKLEYMGYEGQDKVQSPAGFAKLFTCTKTLVLRDTKVDLNFVPLYIKSHLEHLQIEYTRFIAPKQNEGNRIFLRSFIGRKSDWNADFGDFTNLKYMQMIEVFEPTQNNFLKNFLTEYGSQLTSLRSIVYNNRKDTKLHSMHTLLPRESMLDLIFMSPSEA